MTGLGIDLGSRQAKFAALNGPEIAWLREYDTIPFYKRFGGMREGRLTLDFDAMGLLGPKEQAAVPLVVTGYGRNTLALEGARVVPEIQAHVAGVRFQTGLETFTMLDLGGQDSKVARVEDGILMDFLMNDKCAASSGRYLENMAQVLDVSLEELSRHYREPRAARRHLRHFRRERADREDHRGPPAGEPLRRGEQHPAPSGRPDASPLPPGPHRRHRRRRAKPRLSRAAEGGDRRRRTRPPRAPAQRGHRLRLAGGDG